MKDYTCKTLNLNDYLINNNHPNFHMDENFSIFHLKIYQKDNEILDNGSNCYILMTNFQDTTLQGILIVMIQIQIQMI